MSNKKPQPLISEKPIRRCPVCNDISYSASGIHPQCAVLREDTKRMDRLKALRAGHDADDPEGDL